MNIWPFNRQQKQQEFVQKLGKDRPYTPDMVELEEARYRLLFVCDDMMVPHKNYSLIKEHSSKIVRGFSQDRFDFRVGRHTGKALPLMSRQGLRLKGEVHAIDSHHFPELDNHYRNGVEFARVKIKVITVDRDHEMVNIGQEKYLKRFPPGMIRTVPELGIRHYLSNQHVHLVSARMYVAIRSHWTRDGEAELDKSFPTPAPQFPVDPPVWLPKYYKYPIERNRCLPR